MLKQRKSKFALWYATACQGRLEKKHKIAGGLTELDALTLRSRLRAESPIFQPVVLIREQEVANER